MNRSSCSLFRIWTGAYSFFGRTIPSVGLATVRRRLIAASIASCSIMCIARTELPERDFLRSLYMVCTSTRVTREICFCPR